MKVRGETKLFFNSDKITANLIQRRLSEGFERYTVIEHTIFASHHSLHIQFTKNLKEFKGKTLNFYSKRALIEFEREFPSIVKIYDFTLKQIIKDFTTDVTMNNRMVIYSNNAPKDQ